MKSIYITLACLLLAVSAYSQQRFGNADGIKKAEMNGEFAVQFAETNNKYFWAIDLNQLTADQKGKFESLIFEDNQLVAVSSPNTENVWYLSTLKTFTKEDTHLSLIKFKEKATLSNSTVNTKYN